MLSCLPFNSCRDPSAPLFFFSFFFFVHIIYWHFCPAQSKWKNSTSPRRYTCERHNIMYAACFRLTQMRKVIFLLKLFASFSTFHLWRGAAGAPCSYFSAIESQVHEYECVLLKSRALIPVAKIKDSCLVLARRCIRNAQTHLTLNKGLFLHLQSAGGSSSHRSFLSSP